MNFIDVAHLFETVQKTQKRIEKTAIIAQSIEQADIQDVFSILLLLQGRVFPFAQRKKLNVSGQTVIKALQRATGVSLTLIQTQYKQLGDLGLVAQYCVAHKQQASLFTQPLTLHTLMQTLQRLPQISGAQSVDQKIGMLSQLFGDAQPLEAKYITRITLEMMRIGVNESTILDALVWSLIPGITSVLYQQPFSKDAIHMIREPSEFASHTIESYKQLTCDAQDARLLFDYVAKALKYAYDMCNDASVVMQYVTQHGIANLYAFPVTLGVPLRSMLAQKQASVQEAFAHMGSPLAFEYKYDGFRVQLHKQGNRIWLFTRGLEDVTTQFPDVVAACKALPDCIIDGEVMGIDAKGRFLPFQHISQRILRKHNIETLVQQVPVVFIAFDILYHDNKILLRLPFKERRTVLETYNLRVSTLCITDDVTVASDFFTASLQEGNEGMMAKVLQASYQPGSRVGTMVKLKHMMDTLDVVITKGVWGEGKRSQWLTSFTVCCQDDDGNLLEIGNVSTGLKELEEQGVSFAYLTKLLQACIIREEGKQVEVKPEVVIEIGYEEIQKSTQYTSGYALRFPRFISLREKSVDEISELHTMRQLYDEQRNNTRKNE
ncbi:MAG: ATP-dependent DNA ligase [Candidatus Woesearchaeota archaeon]